MEVDVCWVEWILCNLIVNVIDYVEYKLVWIWMVVDEDMVVVIVCDYGVGLWFGEEKLVFSWFWCLDFLWVCWFGGIGLGLVISVEDV